jgi:hypothetical protein
MPKLTPDDPRFWKAHGISPKVRRRRGYHRYEKGDPEELLYAAWPDEVNRHLIDSKIAPAGAGWIIPRRPPPGLDLEDVYAELRPNNPVMIDCHDHYHGRRPLTEEEHKKLKGEWVMDAWEARRHINKSFKKGGHGGKNREDVHPYVHKAKYVLPKGDGRAKRIDCHPLAAERLANAERIYFGIEGCLKADAILTAIRETGEKASVMSVPSVTLWPWQEEEGDLSELERVAMRHYRGRQILLVPDADWKNNVMVYRQAFLFRSYLERLEIDAHVLAPPLAKDAEFDEDGKPRLNGADDNLGAGGKLGDFVVVDRPVPDIVAYIQKQELQPLGIKRHGADLLKTLALHSGMDIGEDGKTPIWTNNGTVSYSLATIGKILGMSPRTAQRTMKKLCKNGYVTLVEGSEKIDEGWARKGKLLSEDEQEPELDKSGFPLDKTVYWQDWDYVKRPTYLLPEEIWPEPKLTETPLREFHSTVSRYTTTDVKELETVEIETFLLQGLKLKQVAQLTGAPLDIVSKISAAAKLNKKFGVEIDGEAFEFVPASPRPPQVATFDGENGQRLVLTLTNKGQSPVTVEIKRPTNRRPRLLYEVEVDGKSDLVHEFELRDSGEHEIAVASAVQAFEVEYVNGKPRPAPEFRSFEPVTGKIRSLV